MLKAELGGKLRREAERVHERLEDVLTSNVLGAFTYLPPNLLLVPFLERAISFSDARRFAMPPDATDIRCHFWPRIPQKFGEPDVVVTFSTAAGRHAVLVEAKLGAGKTQRGYGGVDEDDMDPVDVELSDQLARYMNGLVQHGFRTRNRVHHGPFAPDRVDCIFLTADSSTPEAQMEESALVLGRGPEPSLGQRLYWLSWASALHVLGTLNRDELDAGRAMLCDDVEKCLLRRGFQVWREWNEAPASPAVTLWTTTPHGWLPRSSPSPPDHRFWSTQPRWLTIWSASLPSWGWSAGLQTFWPAQRPNIPTVTAWRS